MSDKPRMYRGEVKKEINNNRCVYASYNDKNDRKNNNGFVYDTSSVRKKINDIFSSNTFIYRTKVNIVMDNETLTKKIVGVYNDNLITIDNEHIPINMIRDIYR